MKALPQSPISSSRVYLTATPNRFPWGCVDLQVQPPFHSLDDRWRAAWVLGDTTHLVGAAHVASSGHVEAGSLQGSQAAGLELNFYEALLCSSVGH